MIFIDTPALIGSLSGRRVSLGKLQMLLASGEQVMFSTMVLYEWLRGPRIQQELIQQESLFPRERAIPFGPGEAALAADLYKRLERARGREIDLAIAATALAHDAPLWTLNPQDFRDIPGLHLV